MTGRTSRRALRILSVIALSAAPAVALVGIAGPAGAVDAGDEATFRTAWDTATDITLTADITLTCANGGDADRSSGANVVLDGQGHTVALEAGCQDRVLDQNGDGATTLRNVTITGGNTSSDGGGYEHDGSGSLTIDRSVIADNIACSEGGGVELEQPVSVTILNSTFSGNRSSEESAIDLDEGGNLLVVNSTFTGNVANRSGAIYAENGNDNTINLVYATVVGNIETAAVCTDELTGTVAGEAEAPEPEAEDAVEPSDAGEAANIAADFTYTLVPFGSVVALPQGTGSPTPNCDLENPGTASVGYNFSDDDTCGFTNVATGDRENAGDPQLGALADNGGPTPTMLPASTSPLVNFIPIAACGGGDVLAGFAVTTDQRGVTRPQGTGCEIGAVEVEAEEIVVRFTG